MIMNMKADKNKKTSSAQQKNLGNRWVFLFKDQMTNYKLEDDNIDMVPLRHSGSGKKAMFLFTAGNNTVQEILSFGESKRSWFINNTVLSNGNLYLTSPIDPLFLIMPYLQEHCSSQAAPLDQILRDADFPEIVRLSNFCAAEQLCLIAERRGPLELNAYKYSEEKTMKWLANKVLRVSDLLKNKQIHVGSDAISATYIKSEKCEPTSDEDYKKYAFGIVSEYISLDLSLTLRKHLGMPDEAESHKRKSSSAGELNGKRIKLELNNGLNSELSEYRIPEKQKIPSAKEKAWVKAATGTKSISSFFKKK